jgi:nitroimidazol reductase NimA-like FMN-containing flavoprotein (pyridoxamine 5'-phosphate oxidase superfamily)
MSDVRRLETLTRDESLSLLASVSLGRIVFTHLALPALRPVPHLVDGPRIIIRAELGSAITAAVGVDGGTVVAYEADLIDPAEYLGWSVVVVGRASPLTDEAECAKYRQLLRPWVTGAKEDIIAIRTDMIDGFRMVHDTGTGADAGDQAQP